MSDSPEHIIATGMANVLALTGPVREATMGYRKLLMDKGMSQESAEQCSVDFHAWLMKMLPAAAK